MQRILFSFLILFTTVLSQRDFSHGKFGLLSLGTASCDSHATQPTVHVGCLSVSIIHQTLTRTAGSLTCAQILMCEIAHGGVRTHVRESALKVDSGRKIPCHTRESNLRQWCDGPMSNQLSHIPTNPVLSSKLPLRPHKLSV